MGTEFCKGCTNSLMSKTESQNNINDFIGGVCYAKPDKISKMQLYNSNPPIHYQDR